MVQVSRNDAAYQVTAQPATVGKIAVVRVNGLGDLMFAFPALQALRETFKKAEIILLAKASVTFSKDVAARLTALSSCRRRLESALP
jgi:hypothetical protein